MKIGLIGAGKLGLPVALAIQAAGHEVIVTDVNSEVAGYLVDRAIPYLEEGAQELLDTHDVKFTSNTRNVIEGSDIVFIAVQTPHDKRYEGITPMPQERKDFDYTYLKEAIADASFNAGHLNKNITLVIISTVLPGTIEREIKPFITPLVTIVYNPFFIAMGTTIQDFRNPEFVLLGMEGDPMKTYKAKQLLGSFYKTIHYAPLYFTGIKEAELIKVAYNTYIAMKIAYANTLMEISHKMGIDCDEVTTAIGKADIRLMSPKYLTGGMGDGGGCHPRDNIAMSWLAKKLNLSHDLFTDIMEAREDQTEWLAQLIYDEFMDWNKTEPRAPIVTILGSAFKENTNLTNGSPAILLLHMLRDKFSVVANMIDPIVTSTPLMSGKVISIDMEQLRFESKQIFFIGTKHDCFQQINFPSGSTVIDPWRYLKFVGDGVKYIAVGKPV